MNFSPFALFRKRALEAQLPPGVTLTPIGPVKNDSPKNGITMTSLGPVKDVPALSEVEALTAKISSLTAERDQAVAFNADISAKFEAITSELSAVKLERDTAVSERDAAKALAAKTREEVTSEVRQIELASLAASQGIPAAEIVPAAGPGADPAQELEDTIKEMQAATDSRQRGALAAKVSALRANLKNKK